MSRLDDHQRSQLHYAAAEGDEGLVAELLAARHFNFVNARDLDGWTPLHFAAQARSVPVATLLLAEGANPNVHDSYGNGPLWTSVLGGSPSVELIALLLECGADPHHVNKHGRSPIAVAREIGHGLEEPFQQY